MARKPTYDDLVRKVKKLELQTLELHSTQGELRTREQTLDTILSASPAGIGLVKPDRTLGWSNQAMHALLAYEYGELEGKPVDILYPSEIVSEKVGRQLWAEIREQGQACLNTQMVRRNGELIDVIVRANPLDREDPTKGMIATVENFTLQRLSEDKLRNSEQKYRDLVENMDEVFYSTDLNGVFTYISPACKAIAGYEPSDVIGCSFVTFLHPEDKDRIAGDFQNTVSGLLSQADYRIIHKNGDTRWVQSNSKPIYRGKEVVAIQGILSDISHHKQAQSALQRSEDTLKSIFLAAPIGIGLTSQRILQEVNQRICEMLGYDRDELVGKSARVLYPDQQEFEWVGEAKYAQIHEHGTGTVETRWQCKDGSIINVLLSSTALNPDETTAEVTFTALDITDRKQTELQLQMLSTAIENAGEEVIVADIDGEIQYVNPAFERITGYSKSEVIGKNPRFLKSGRHSSSFYRKMWATLSSGQIWAGQLTNRRKDGTIFIEEANISPIQNSSGELIGYVAIKRDVTEQEKLKNRLIQAQKMEAIGTLAGGIAHDFNNILSAIVGYTEIAIHQEIPAGHPARYSMDQVRKASARASNLVRQILAFSRLQEEELKPINIKPIAKEVLDLLRASLPTTVAIKQNLYSRLETILGDPGRIHQLLMNLCTNAAQAMRENGGILQVNTSVVNLTEKKAATLGGISAGPYLKLAVSDTGCGMSAAVAERIFEPYFTTKEKGSGTGLGLAVVHGIVESMNGSVSVDSTPGKGTIFTVLFPVIAPDALPEIEEKEVIPGGHERILFVDDEKALTDIARLSFEKLGYSVTTRNNGMDALELFQINASGYDIVITDMTMPGLTGDKLAAEMLKIRPDIPIVLCTGYSELITAEKARAIGIKEFVMKPVVMKEMAKTIRQVLNQD